MLDIQKIKCPKCGKEIELPANQPLYISLDKDIKCPECGQILISCNKPLL